VTGGGLSWLGRAVLLAVLPAVLATGCRHPAGSPSSARVQQAVPSSSAELGALVVTRVASGLRRVPDAELKPPAGPKRLEDIASYSTDAAEQRTVLRGYGYRFGWERFWGTPSGPMTGVFVDQFRTPDGAAAYAQDLAHNDAGHYHAMLRENAPTLPSGCRTLTVDPPEPAAGLRLPASFVWCTHGVFSVSVTAMAQRAAAAEAEVRSVLAAQLDRLPPR
jgi:hypothetical protein